MRGGDGMRGIALRNVWRQRGRSLFVLAASALGVAALILAGGFIKDTIVELGDSIIYSQTGHLQLNRAGYRSAASFDPEAFIMRDTDTLRTQLESYAQVKQVLLRLYTAGLAGNGESDWPVLIEGVEPEGEAQLGSYINISQGRPLAPGDSFGVLVGAGVAAALELDPGDWIDLVTTTLDGSMNSLEFEVVGVFQTFSKDYDTHALRIVLPAARELLAAEGANVAVVELHDTSSTGASAEQFREDFSSSEIAVWRWENLDPFYKQTVTLYQQQFGFLIVVISALVVLGVSTAIGMGIHERTAEFGTMRALGTRDLSVAWMILLESAFLGLAGASLGVLLGNAGALLISSIGIPMPPPPNSDLGYISLIRPSFAVSLLAWLVGVAAPVLAALPSARRQSRGPIVSALQHAA